MLPRRRGSPDRSSAAAAAAAAGQQQQYCSAPDDDDAAASGSRACAEDCQTTSSPCSAEGSDALQILGQFERLYQCRVAEVEADHRVSDSQRAELKLKIMTDWVKDLGEQNAMLVQTVHDLEQAAVCRVKLLENKLQATSNLISHNMSHSEKSEEDLNVLSNRICHLVSDQNDMQKRIDFLQSDIGNLLELIKRGRADNNWNLDGIKFYEIQPSDIPAPVDCTCNQITSLIDNEDNACDKTDLQIKKLSEQLHNTETKMEKRLNEYKYKENELEVKISKMQRESEKLKKHLACLEKESVESREALTAEVAQKHDALLSLKSKIKSLEEQLCDSGQKLQFKDEVIHQLRENLKKDSEKDEKIKLLEEQLVEFKSKLQLKNNVKIAEEKVPTTRKVKISTDSCEKVENSPQDISIENQHEILVYLMNLKASMEKDSETIHSLKSEYETVLKSLKQTMNIYEKDVALANEKLQDIKTCLCNYRSEVIDQDFTKDSIKMFISTIEKKIVFIEKLFQNNCRKCEKENIQSEMKDIISQVTVSTQKLSKIDENKNKIISSIQSMVSKSKTKSNQNTANEEEQKAILDAICQQFRMMEEFRICTVEVQAATEDLREEISEVISNLNSRHCKYVELNENVSQLQDNLTKTRENMSEVINHLELQEGERARHSERIINNKIRLKDIKNEFNKTQSELSKCLNNVQNNINQHTSLLGFTEIHTCNDLLISVVEEVEQIVNNINTFQSQGCQTLSTVTEVKRQLTVAEVNVKELKRKSEQILKENEIAQKSFEEKLKRLEKYECEVDNCHSKMQDVLESIISTRDQMNEFGCIQESQNSFESTNEAIKLKEELRKSYKECEELKAKVSLTPQKINENETLLEWQNNVVDLQDQIQVLKNEMKCKQQSNIFLKQSIDSLEKELYSSRAKAEDNRRCSSSECLDLKKKIFELENLLKVQKDIENNLKCLVNNETDFKKSQLLDYVKDRHCDGSIVHSLPGTNENICQMFKGLQDKIEATKIGLQELADKLKRLVPEGSSHSYNTNNSLQAASEILATYVENINYCFFEVEKIKTALYSKDKLMENMDKIIRIQKDSITISQSEVEDVHKTLQEKIDVQEKVIAKFEKEKRHLTQQIELQVQTIGHLQDAVVEAKKTIDQLSNKAASDNLSKSQIIKTLKMYLSESQSQYSECYGEASEQDLLLELQRDAINTLQMKISHLKYDEFIHALFLHFIYYVILFKYQEELNFQNQKFEKMTCKIKELECAKNYSDEQCENIQSKYREASKQIEKLWCTFEESRKQFCAQKQRELNKLLCENEDLRKQLQVYKLNFDIIEDEIKKMGIVNNSVESFKIEIDKLRSENDKFKCSIDNYKKEIIELKHSNECLTKTLQESQVCNNAGIDKYKEKIMNLQCEVIQKKEEIKRLNTELINNEAMIGELLNLIEELKRDLYETEQRLNSCHSDLCSSQQTNCALRHHIDSLKRLQEKFELFEKLEKDNYDLKSEQNIMKSNMSLHNEKLMGELSILKYKLKQTQCELAETQKNHDKTLLDLNRTKGQLVKIISERRSSDVYLHPSSACQASSRHDQSSAHGQHEIDELKRLTKDLDDCQKNLSSRNTAYSEMQTKYNSMSNKCDTFERSCQRQKGEIMLLEKKLGCMSQKFQNCKEKNEELIRQNKSFEDSNNKCMAELEDIMLQLEDMQSSLVDLRSECDAKSQSLDCVSAELARMKVSRSEVCEESSHVLNWLRRWMREQKQTAAALQERLFRLGTEKKNFINEMKRLKRLNRVLVKRLKLVPRPVGKRLPVIDPSCFSTLSSSAKSQVKQRNGLRNGFHLYSQRKESSAVYSYFRRECREGSNRTVDKITTQGDYRLFRTLEHLTKQVPITSQINDNNVRSNRLIHEDTADHGYQTSSSK